MKLALFLLAVSAFSSGFQSMEDPAFSAALGDALKAWSSKPKLPGAKTEPGNPRKVSCTPDGGITRDPNSCCGSLGDRVSDTAWRCDPPRTPEDPAAPQVSPRTFPISRPGRSCAPAGGIARTPSECCSGRVNGRASHDTNYCE